MKWVLGLDLGSNSIGWWAYDAEITSASRTIVKGTLDGGVRIFPDGREPSSKGRVGDSLAVSRRMARGSRRNREHASLRFKKLVTLLIQHDLLPSRSDQRKNVIRGLNPYEARAWAAEHAASDKNERYAIGRALFSMGRRRGYLSNRKEASDDEGGKLKARMTELEDALEGRTLGQFLWEQFKTENLPDDKGNFKKSPTAIRFKDNNKFFANRALYRDEFAQIKNQQKEALSLSEEDWDKLELYCLEQRPLKPVERGRCSLFITEPRHWADTPIGHAFRIYQELNNLAVIETNFSSHPLSKEQYQAVLNKLQTQKTATFGALRKLKDASGNALFPRGSKFNLETPKRNALNGHSIAVDLAADPIFKPLCSPSFSAERLDDIFEILHEAETDEQASIELCKLLPLDNDLVKKLIGFKLAKKTANLSRQAMTKLTEIMEHQGLQYWEAVDELAKDEEQPMLRNPMLEQERYNLLPYYGQIMPENMLGARPNDFNAHENPEKHYGRINNPSVHVALNQLRRLINELVTRFGTSPTKINLEMTRDLKLPKKIREEVERNQAKNETTNSRIRSKLKNDFGIEHASADDLKKFKLWEELGKNKLERECVYSGQMISAAMLFSGEVEIEHILPFSRTLDNSLSNLTLSMRWANRLKGNLTPFEAFSSNIHHKDNVVWDDIIRRANHLPQNKQWRFAKDAISQFERENGFIARQLTDTAYMTRTARRYLMALDGVGDVVTLPGRLTAMIRGKWRLNGILADDNQKSRDDHRHHAVDAAVIGLIDRGLLQQISKLSGRADNGKAYIKIPQLDEEIENSIRNRVPTILPSFKIDHGLGGKVFKETAYGFTKDPGHVVTRKPLTGLSAKEVSAIRSDEIREKLETFRQNNPDKKLEIQLAEFGVKENIRRVRITVKAETVEPVPSAPYKGYAKDSFVCCDIWQIPPKKKGGKFSFQGKYWTYANVHKGAIDKLLGKPHPAAKYITRLFKNDLISVGTNDNIEIYKVAGFSTTDNRLDLRSPYPTDPPRQYMSINIIGLKGLQRLPVRPDGRITSLPPSKQP
jgi:CRISPR-associated endonuclease Csn1